MNILLLRVIKISVFLLAYYIFSKIALSYFKKKNPAASMTDPEIIVTGVIAAAVITTPVSLILKSFIR